ncbi:MAG: hypothetical protein HYY23_20540 [Verrucomicrobia bacterium]|nr:hypothetical protein [Verrucomicrobiota bacterium]
MVDVLAAYTAEARIGAGGNESIESLIKLAVAEANTVYQNSLVDVRLRLVDLREVNYPEFPSNATNLNRLQSRSDGFLDEIHLMRETNRADLVCLITEHGDPGVSGLAFTMGAPTFAFRDSAFSVAKRADLSGSYIFVHEISHNFGAQHDREHALDGEGKLKSGSYPFSFGHRFAVNDIVYRDVMSYAPGQPIPYLSNPDILFMGVPIGLPGTTNGANNALTVNANALLVADFFGPAVQTVPPAIQMLAPTNGTILREGTNLVISAQASDADGGVRQMEFYHENTLLGVTTNGAPASGTNVISVDWINLPPGRFTITARATDNLGASSAALPTEIIVRPTHDSFTNRIALSGLAPSISGSNREATVDPGEAMHGGNPGGSSVWYSWTAPKDGTVSVTVTGLGIVPLPEVYKSLTSTTLFSVSREFEFDQANFIARTTFDATANESYSIAVDSLAGTAGEFNLSLTYQPPPPHDNFSNRIQLSGETISITGTNLAATKEPGEPKHAQNLGGKSVWYSWIAPKGGTVLVSVTTTNFFPLTDVYTGASVSALAVAPGRDFTLDTTNRVMTLHFDAAANREYAIAVDGFAGQAGPFGLALKYPPPPPNDDFRNRAPLAGASLTVKSANLYATRENGEPDKHAGVPSSRSIWFSWTAPVSGPVAVTLTGRGTEFIPWAAAYTGNSLTNLSMASGMAVRFDTNILATRLTFNATALTTYALAIDGFSSRTGPINLALATSNSPPAIQSLFVPVILGGGQKLAITGTIGQKFALQASTNLVDWAEIFSGLFATNKAEVIDTNSLQFKYRFYRALPLP